MVAEGQSPVITMRPQHAILLILVAVGSLAALVAVPVLAFSDLPPVLAVLVPVGCMGIATVLWSTQAGMCFAAFAIGPLGVIQYEFASITVNLPEVLILALFAKEFVRFILKGERPVSFAGWSGLFVFLLVSAIGLITAFRLNNPPIAALQNLRQYVEYIVLYLLVVHRVTSRREMRTILSAFVLGMTLLACHGVFQRLTGYGIPNTQLASDAVYHGGIRGGSFYGATPLGGMMVLAVSVTAGLLLSTTSRPARLVLIGCGVLCLTAAVFTNTRASWVAIAFSLIYVFFSTPKTRWVMAFTIAGILVFSTALGPIVVKRMQTIEVSKKERSLLDRVRYYTAAWHIAREYPVFGLGWGCRFDVNAILRHGRYVRPRQLPEKLEGSRAQNTSTVHSAYLQILVRIGFVGLAGFLVFLAQWFFRIVRERTITDKSIADHKLFIGLTAGLLGYLIHAAIENFFQWPVMAQSFWLLLGISTVMANQLRQQGHLSGAKPSPARAEG